jgi:molybdenum cofactor cytidylyltransferase
MGSCKQLLPLGGTSAIARCLQTLLRGGVTEIVVVVSPEGGEVADAARAYPVRVVFNDEPGGDMASSVRVGRDALAPGTATVMVALCDHPLVTRDTVARLLLSHGAEPERIIIPSHGGRRGHPIILPRPLLDELRGELTLRDLVARYPSRLRHLEVDDPGIVLEMDTPEEYHRLCQIVAASE